MKTLSIPDLRGDRAYSIAADRLAELQARDADLERRRRAGSEGRNRQALTTVRAERLILDDVIDRADYEELDRREELALIADELNVVREAIKLQRQVVERERQRVSHEICVKVAPRYRDNIKAIAAALEQLSPALEAERQLREELISADIDFVAHLRPMPLPAIGTLSEPNSNASLWLAEAREHDLLK